MSTRAITYEGNVSIKYYSHGKQIEYRGHNEGLNALFKFVCKTLTGNISSVSQDIPSFIDIRLIYQQDNTTVSTSCLYNLLELSNLEYLYDSTNTRWVTRLNATLSNNMINFDLLNAHQDADVYIYLMDGNTTKNDIARLELDDAQIDLNDIIAGTQAIIEWTMIFKNEE